MNTGILLSGFPPEMNRVVKAVVVLCVLIVQSQRFISLIKAGRNRIKRNLPLADDHHRLPSLCWVISTVWTQFPGFASTRVICNILTDNAFLG